MHPPTSLIPADAPALPDSGRIVAAVRAAAEATGVSFDYLIAQANQESRLNPNAHNHHSSAAGLFQFTGSTWLDMIKRHGAAHGLGDLAAAIRRGSDGRLHVNDKTLRHAILDLRRDPEVSALMAAEYAKDNQRTLQARLGRPVSAGDLYLAHFLGAAGAVKVLKEIAAAPKADAAGLLPEAAHANAGVFHGAAGEARSVAALYKAVQTRFNHAMGTAFDAPPVQDELASLRPKPRPEDDTQVAALAPAPTTTPPAAAAAEATTTHPPFQYFPVPIPPPPSQARPDNVTMGNLIQAMDGEDG